MVTVVDAVNLLKDFPATISFAIAAKVGRAMRTSGPSSILLTEQIEFADV
jgi:G3E family GTPase